MKQILIILLIILSSACSSIQMPEPAISLADMQMVNISLFETSLRGAVRIQNNSSKPLTINGSEHELIINDINLGVARSDETITLAPYSDGIQKFQMTLSNIKFLSRLEKILNSQKFSYKISSRLYLPGLWGLKYVSSTAEGQY